MPPLAPPPRPTTAGPPARMYPSEAASFTAPAPMPPPTPTPAPTPPMDTPLLPAGFETTPVVSPDLVSTMPAVPLSCAPACADLLA